jgi:hypothetical protein
MLPNWLSSWYQQQNVHQLQEPFNDQYETAAGEDGDWVEVLTPNTKRRQPPTKTTESTNSAVKSELPSSGNQPEVATKALSRQERRAMARSEIREKKKQARTAAMAMVRNRGMTSSTCLPSSPLTAAN